MFSLRKIVAFVCLAAVVLAAIAPSAPGLLWALVVPLLLFALLEAVSAERELETAAVPICHFVSRLSSRAPPIA
jgi:hypothetical protein